MQGKWVEWGQRLQSIAQIGLTFCDNTFDIERYKQIQQIAAEMISDHTNQTPELILDYFNKETGYATPKVDTRGVVFKEDKILLVRERLDNKWTLPGGWADVCSSPSENVVREIFEESGYQTNTKRLLAVYDRALHGHKPDLPYHIYKMFFLCELIGGEAKTSIETSEIDFFGKDEIPELSNTRITEKQIQRMFELKDLNITDFD